MNKHLLYALFVSFIAVWCANPAFAQTICPPNMIQALSPDTQMAVCCPLNIDINDDSQRLQCAPANVPIQCPPNMVLQTDPYTHQLTCVLQNSDPYTQHPTQTNLNSSNTAKTLDEQRQIATIVAQQQIATNESEIQKFFNTIPLTSEEAEAARISEAVLDSGVVLSLGIGYGMLVAGIGDVSIGYIFSPQHIHITDDIRFALFLEVEGGGPFPVIIMGLITPKLLWTKNTFQFSLGLGIGGAVIDGNIDYGYVNEPSFILRPSLDFDWYVTPDWFVGFSLDIPIYLHEKYSGHGEYTEVLEGENGGVLFDILLHAGYKF